MQLRSLHDQIADKCVNFNGLQNSACEAGVVYDELDKENRQHMRCSLPCFKEGGYLSSKIGGTKCRCDKMRFPTEEEVQAEVAMWDRESKKVDEGMKAVAHIRKEHKGEDWSGWDECPICKGKLHVSHAACNGHVHAKCETADCIAWME